MKDIIGKVLRESIDRFILNERLSGVLYHFTNIAALYGIVKNDSFRLRNSFGRVSDDMHNTKKFYLSCTRQKSGMLGYSRNKNVRITLDGDLLNNRYSGGAVDYWGKSMGKQSYYDKEKYNKVDYYQPNTENEDRLYSDEPIIRNANRYIKRIDILFKNKNNDNRLSYIYHILLSGLSDRIFVYDNEDDFNYQTKNTINNEITNNHSLYDNIPNSMAHKDSVFYGIAHILSFFILIDSLNGGDYKAYCAKMLKKYGLGNYINNILGKVNIYMNINHFDTTTLDGIRTNDVSGEIYEKSFIMLRDFLRERGYNNIQDAVEDYKKKLNGKRYSDYDYDMYIDVFVFQPNGYSDRYGNIVILHPEKTLFWSIEEFQYAKKYFVDDVVRMVRSHNSVNDESFYKYVQHMVKGKVTVSEMISFLNKLNVGDNDDIIDYLFSGKFKTISMKYFNIENQQFVNDTDKKELEDKFIV
ncbi:MAG: hypothetical protein IKT40_12575 [Bacilli bacterium]|nr:hypothetical protein [Bacilli bacterium]